MQGHGQQPNRSAANRDAARHSQRGRGYSQSKGVRLRPPAALPDHPREHAGSLAFPHQSRVMIRMGGLQIFATTRWQFKIWETWGKQGENPEYGRAAFKSGASPTLSFAHDLWNLTQQASPSYTPSRPRLSQCPSTPRILRLLPTAVLPWSRHDVSMRPRRRCGSLCGTTPRSSSLPFLHRELYQSSIWLAVTVAIYI